MATPEKDIRFSAASTTDAEELADIRVEAMRPSLEALGRFDRQRAKDRFLNSFEPTDTRIIRSGEEVVGFFVVRRKVDHLYLDHLYIRDRHQGMGIGRIVVDRVKNQARDLSLPIRLMALKGSPANAFYLSLGFEFVSADAFDTLYQWLP
jgi:GNAT superfamily N-acetyltransferase